ncbi:MAG: YfiR/HmsC family protein [Oligoflexia bacterium]|nr:YfiR/HmsC family protein [Oligoflexia bacterium]
MDLVSKEPIALLPGSVVASRYQIIRCLGIGSMGMVYLARTVSGGTPLCALKVLSPADTHAAAYANFLARFRNEIQSARRVRHPNVVQVYDCIEDESVTACAMEYVGGGDLGQLIRRHAGPFPPGEVVRLMREMCAGVEAIHRAGIIHRDIKPANMLLSEQGQIKISDFGLARSEESPKLTARGGVAGTIQYLSPQYLEGGHVSTLGDIYALGTIAYELAAGALPYAGVSVFQLIELKVNSDPIPPHEVNKDCPLELSAAIMRALSRDPGHRYQTAMEFATALGKVPVTEAPSLGPPIRQIQFSKTTPTPVRRRGQLMRIGVGGVALGVLVFMLMFGALPRLLSGAAEPATDGGTSETLAANLASVVANEAGQVTSPHTGFVAQPAAVHSESSASFNGDGSAIFIPSIVRLGAIQTKQRTRVFELRRRVARVSADNPAIVADSTKFASSSSSPSTLSASVAEAGEGAEPTAEAKVRGTLLYRLADYVEWPSRAFANSSAPFQICLMGSDPFGPSFDRLLSRIVSKSGRGFSLQRRPIGTAAAQLRSCQVLYLGSDLNTRSADILSSVRRDPVLTVTDGSDEGIVDFVNQDRKVKFGINKRRAREAGLTVGSLLLDLAAKITE